MIGYIILNTFLLGLLKPYYFLNTNPRQKLPCEFIPRGGFLGQSKSQSTLFVEKQ